MEKHDSASEHYSWEHGGNKQQKRQGGRGDTTQIYYVLYNVSKQNAV